ncbi:hypothetical protein QDR37_14020 [Amnibacterium sp. CER49]|uniref:DUF6804 family protein n=1 Tax=Amnibacterium sp. CER49 TaxID=3039161 RepID=UPI00244AD0CF|nr:DUF6804 family protein [Amnibacterium sp. CER49]MDH2445067.1 hypothetical protein [Amnibacterium sp. CER49]
MSSGNRRERRAAATAPRSTVEHRYGSPVERRALVPAVLGAIVLLAGVALIDTAGFSWIRMSAAVLAFITAVLVWQAGHRVLVVVPIVLGVLWNPVVPFPFSGEPWRIGQVVGAAVLVVTGFLSKGRRQD